MSDTASFRLEHSTWIRQEPAQVFELLVSVDRWPEIFPSCVAASVLEQGEGSMRIELTAHIGGGTHTARSRRVLSPSGYRIDFEQESPLPPLTAVSGAWEVVPEPGFGCRVVLTRDCTVSAGSDRFASAQEAEQWLRKVLDASSREELRALKAASEGGRRPISELLTLTRTRFSPPPIRYDGLLRATARRSPHRDAILHDGISVTFSALDALTDAVARVLHEELGVRPGEVVALTACLRPEALVTFLAISRIGAVVTPINPLYGPREIEHQLRDTEAVAAVLSGAMYPLVAGLRERLPRLRRQVGFGGAASGDSSLLELAARQSPESFPEVEVSPDAVLSIPYSSGTSGLPKGVMLSHRNLVSNALQFVSAHHVSEADVLLNGLPVLLSMHLGASMASGATQVLLDRWDPRRLLHLAREHEATQLYTVTPMVAALSALEDLESLRAPRLRFISSGASSLDVRVARQASRRLGLPVLQGFGLTEASPLTHATPVFPGYQGPPGACGLPVADTEQRIVDTLTGEHEVPPGTVGQLCIRGPQVMRGYWKGEEETRRALRDGWLYTGDLVFVDDEGFLHYVDRLKDVIKHEGHSIAPAELEAALKEHPAVKDCLVVGVDVGHDEQLPYAFVVPRPSAPEPARVLAEVNPRLAGYKRIAHIEFINTIPRSGAGKLLRRVLRERAQQNAGLQERAAPPSPPGV
ncbi:AMP-binding protein [Pyxidicoccus trucidator]|uniref:AMP-binding protein n=1 Tax=Pyxidicoccus trucidator TaxID=2709662 RepID=UPI0013DB29D0|nr:AMP-binding protein [Pyxidicoccus trucidator]